jgi:hypothetical protein
MFYTKTIFDQLHKLSFIFQKFSSLKIFPYFFFFSFFSFVSFLLSFFFLPLFFSLTQAQPMHVQNRGELATAMAPPAPPPLLPLSGELPWSFKSGHVRLPWRASHKLIFLREMAKTDAYELPLAIPTLNFIQNEL